MPDILLQVIAGGVFTALVVFLLILITPALIRRASTQGKSETDDAGEDLCKSCKYDVRGLLRCPECGSPTREVRRQQLAKLRDEWPTESIAVRIPEPGEKPVVIFTGGESLAFDLLGQHLKARGISPQVSRSEDAMGKIPHFEDKALYRFTVWSGDAERATAIVDHLWPREFRN